MICRPHDSECWSDRESELRVDLGVQSSWIDRGRK